MVWSCAACTVRNENDAQVTCGVCNAIRVLECPTCHGEIKCVFAACVRAQKANC